MRERARPPRRLIVLSVVDRGFAPPTEPIMLVPAPRAAPRSPEPAGSGAGRIGRPLLGLAGQILNAGTNVVTAYVASLLLRPDAFGSFVLAFACVTMVLASGRGLLGSTVVVHLPSLPEAARLPLVRSGLGFTLCLGIGVSVLLGLVGGTLLLFAPWVTAALVQDLGRFAFLAEGRSGAALLLDVAWAVVQGAVIAAWVASGGSVGVGLLVTSWGLGALAGAALFVAMTRMRPATPVPWFRATHDVAGWFTAVAVLGAVELYTVLQMTAALLGSADAGGLRAVQLLAYQPAMVLSGALLVLLTPETVHARTSRAALTRALRRMCLMLSPLVLGLLLLVLLAGPLMALLFDQYIAFAPLVLPIALQAVVTVLSVPATVVLRALRRGSAVFTTQFLRVLLLVAAAAGGAVLDGATGLAWALVVATVLSTVQVSVHAITAVRQEVPA